MPAYFAPVKQEARPARDIPEFARLRAGTKWNAGGYNLRGKQGTLAFMGKDAPSPDNKGWNECADGLWYCSGLTMPKQIDLVRPNAVNGIDYTTTRGVTITIPIASAAPRKLLFSMGKAGDLADDWAARAFDLFDKLLQKEFVSVVDPEVLRLVADAIGQLYFTTPEMLDELDWITSADIDPILVCMMGQDPKKAPPPAGDTSPLPAPV